MRPDPAQLLESPDSASPIVSRSVAAGLVGEYHQTYPTNRLQRSALRLLGIFPSGLVRELVSRAQAFTAIKPSSLVGLSVESLAKARVNDYDHLNDTFPAAVIGAALGGAAANLSLAMGGPFLPQAFILTLKGGSPDGNPTTYFHRSADLARQIARQNPDVITIQHFDPVHDGWITKRANHLRLKLTGLPHVYLDFLRRKVQPGGTIYYLECEAGWLRYRTGERSFFQVGGWGGLSPQDFLSPSPALLDYCRTNRLKVCNWQLPGFPLENGPESEWGSEKGLGEALSEFCKEEGYDFVRIQLPEPLDYARLAFSAVSQLLSEEGRNPEGVLIEMFSQFDPTAARLGSLLPLWLVFNTWDSLEFLKEMRSEFPEDKPVFFTAVSTFSMTPDGVPLSEWEQALAGLDWRNIGPRPSHYPSDPLTLIHWNKPLRRWVETQKKPIQGRLTADQVKSLVEKIKPYRTML